MNKITLQQIECFLEVCRDFNFTRAASRLHMAQPPLSRQIRQLETAMGVTLFERTSRKVQLTAAGHSFLEHICVVPQMIQKSIAASQRADTGGTAEIRIGFVGAILNESLYALFRDLRKQHNSITFDLKEGHPPELLTDLEKENLDGAFLGVEVSKLPKDLQQLHWRTEPLVACFPKDHDRGKEQIINIQDLENEKFLTLHPQVAPAYNMFIEQLFIQFATEVEKAGTARSVTSLLSLVIAGAGFALLPASAIGNAKNHLTTVSINQEEAVMREVFVYRRSRQDLLAPLLHLLNSSIQKMEEIAG